MTARESRRETWSRAVGAAKRYLWIHDQDVRTDNSRANRGFYVGGPPVSWRFVLPVVAAGVTIALVILALDLSPN